jgi:MbtH protein
VARAEAKVIGWNKPPNLNSVSSFTGALAVFARADSRITTVDQVSTLASPTTDTHKKPKEDFAMNTEEEDNQKYKVVVNHEEQHSIWPDYREPPLGWKEVGKSGTKAECFAYVKEVWTDMRRLSLRKKMEEAARKG